MRPHWHSCPFTRTIWSSGLTKFRQTYHFHQLLRFRHIRRLCWVSPSDQLIIFTRIIFSTVLANFRQISSFRHIRRFRHHIRQLYGALLANYCIFTRRILPLVLRNFVTFVIQNDQTCQISSHRPISSNLPFSSLHTFLDITPLSCILYQSCHFSPEQAYHKTDMVLVHLSNYLSFYWVISCYSAL